MSDDQRISDTQLRALLAGSLPETEIGRIESLLETDIELRSRLEALSGASLFGVEFEVSAEAVDDAPPEALTSIMSSLKADTHARIPSPTPSIIAGVLAPTEAPNSIGSLGPYEIERHIATGGMGVVYLARDPQLKRQVAIKVLSPSFAGHEEALQRFLREATAAAAIEHPHVLPIYAVDTESSEFPFIVMRYVAGPSVEQLIADHDGPLPFESVKSIAKGVASALAAAHAKDLTHRDLKPSNILLETESPEGGRGIMGIYLTDFGLARIADDVSLTRPGTFLGTPQFSSPEQARGDQCDHRSDLFSLGAVLYNLATGTSPFMGDDNTLSSVIYRVVHQAHRPTCEANPALPPWFSQLVDRLLRKDPATRPPTAAVVLRCLEEESLSPLSPARRSPTTTRAKRILIAALLVGALAIVAPFFFNPSDSAGSGTPTIASTPSFVLAGGDHLSFDTLAAAIAAAPDGGVIELPFTAIFASEPLTIPAGKALTIRAAKGCEPTISSTDLSQPLLTTRGDLHLEGLTLHHGIGNELDVPPLARVESRSFSAAGCRFELPSNLRPRKRAISFLPSIMELSGIERLRLINCELVAAGSAGLRFLSSSGAVPPSIEISNSLVVAYSCLELDHPAAKDDPIAVALDQNFVCCRRTMIFFGTGEPFPAALKVTGNLFTSDTTIVDTRLRIRDLFENVTWAGGNNVYSSPYLGRASERTARPNALGITTMMQWRNLWGEDSGSVKRDLAFRKHLGAYLFEPMKIKARFLDTVPKPEPPLPSDGPITAVVGPGAPYHLWSKGPEAEAWRKRSAP